MGVLNHEYPCQVLTDSAEVMTGCLGKNLLRRGESDTFTSNGSLSLFGGQSTHSLEYDQIVPFYSCGSTPNTLMLTWTSDTAVNTL